MLIRDKTRFCALQQLHAKSKWAVVAWSSITALRLCVL